MSRIVENVIRVTNRIKNATERSGRKAGSVALLAVSKTRTANEVREAFDTGIRDFGENYLQDFLGKREALADLPITWYFIGPVQANKTRQVAEMFDWVLTLDREKIARRLSAQRPAQLPPLQVCLQVNISGESAKSGVAWDQLAPLAAAVNGLPGLNLRGLMAIPAANGDAETLRAGFRQLRETLGGMQGLYPAMDVLSIGMSGDLEIAIEEGATLVRVGTDLFGPRDKNGSPKH